MLTFSFILTIRRQLDLQTISTVGIRVCDSSYIRYIVRRFGHVLHDVPCKKIYFVHLILRPDCCISNWPFFVQFNSFERKKQTSKTLFEFAIHSLSHKPRRRNIGGVITKLIREENITLYERNLPNDFLCTVNIYERKQHI